MPHTDPDLALQQCHQQLVHLHRAGRFSEALGAAATLLDLSQRHFGEEHPVTADALAWTGTLRRDMGDLAGAREPLERVLAIRRRILGDDHPDAAKARFNLGMLFHRMGDHQAALPLLAQSVEFARRLWGENHPQTLAILSHLGNVYLKLDQPHQASDCYQTVLQANVSHYGPQSVQAAAGHYDLAIARFQKGDFPDSRANFEKAIQIYQRTPGEDRDMARTHRDFAQLLLRMSEFDLVRSHLERAVALYQRAFGKDHEITVSMRRELESLLPYLPAPDRPAHGAREEYVVKESPVPREEPRSPANLDDMKRAVASLVEQDLLEEAVALGRRVVERTRELLGNDHPETANRLNALGEVLQLAKRPHDARLCYEQALSLLRRLFGEGHASCAAPLCNLGGLLLHMNDQSGARAHLEEALTICEREFGEMHELTMRVLLHFSGMHMAAGRVSDARRCSERAVAIVRRLPGNWQRELSKVLSGLGHFYGMEGRLAEQRKCLEESLVVCRKNLGNDHPETAVCLEQLGSRLRETGELVDARSALEESLEIRRRVLGENHPQTGLSFGALGALLDVVGDAAGAIEYARKALLVMRASLGEDHRETASALNNLGVMYVKVFDFESARPLLEQSLAICRRVLGEDHLETASSLNTLGSLLVRTGQAEAARPLLEQALAIRTRMLGESHLDSLRSLENLAGVMRDLGEFEQAKATFEKALDLRRRGPGTRHPDFAGSLRNLAGCEVAAGRLESATDLMLEAVAVEDQVMAETFAMTTDRQRLLFLQRLRERDDLVLSHICRNQRSSARAVQSALDLVLRRKAVVAEALSARRDSVLQGEYPELTAELQELSRLRNQLAQVVLSGYGLRDSPAYAAARTTWTQRLENLETKLAGRIPEMRLESLSRTGDHRAVSDAIPEGAVLIEFIKIHDYVIPVGRASLDWNLRPPRYLAFVLHGQEPDNVSLIDLGDAATLDTLIADFRTEIVGTASPSQHRDLGDVPRIDGARPSLHHAMALRTAVFEPLLPALGARNRLLIAPDGDITLVPFEVLPTKDRSRLIDHYRISYVGTGRDVLRFGSKRGGAAGAPVVAADPDFDLGATDSMAPAVSAAHRDSTRAFGELRFSRIEGTRREAERVAEMLHVTPWLGPAALDSRIKACRSPLILHLATHGYFLRDPSQSLDRVGAERKDRHLQARLERFIYTDLENPLLRSGLALAGVNCWLAGRLPPREAEDGLLTAEEVSGMDLSGTELVVLSACESGLGQIEVGEGVFGLGRAFQIAGARTLVTSLWKVSDEHTEELMLDFYRRLLDGEGRAESLRLAQLSLKERQPDPAIWGAFVCQGDPGPLLPAHLR